MDNIKKKEQQDSVWPSQKYRFKVNISSLGEMYFQQAFGLNTYETVQYRTANVPSFLGNKLPHAQHKPIELSLKKCLYPNNDVMYDYLAKVKLNTAPKETVIIQMLDEFDMPVLTYTLKNAWVSKISFASPPSKNSECDIEEMELVSEEEFTLEG